MPWFRLYVEMPTDRKVRRLKPEHRWLWVCLMALARTSPVPGELMISDDEPCSIEDISDFAGLPESTVKRGIKYIAELGMIEQNESKTCWKLPAWQQRQYPSDSSTDRVRAHRNRRDPGDSAVDGTLQTRSMKRSIDVPVTVLETRQKTETETDTETIPYAPSAETEEIEPWQHHENQAPTPERSARIREPKEPTPEANESTDRTSTRSISDSTNSTPKSTGSRSSSSNRSHPTTPPGTPHEPTKANSTSPAPEHSTDDHTHQESTSSASQNETSTEPTSDSEPYENPDPLEDLYEQNTGQTWIDPGVF